MNYLSLVALLLTVLSSEVYSRVDQSQSYIDAKNLLNKIGIMFNTEFDLVVADDLCGFGSEVIEDRNIITTCYSDLLKFDNNFCGPYTSDGLAMIIAHEAAHRLLDTPEDFSYKNFMDTAFSIYERLPLGSKKTIEKYIKTSHPNQDRKESVKGYIFYLGSHQEHEYVDGLAAKILKSLGYSKNIIRGIECIIPLYPEGLFSKKYFENRADAIKNSYIEGWDNWQDYISIYPASGPIFDFLLKHDYIKILEILKNSGKLKPTDLNRELLRRHKRYSNSTFYEGSY